jgi:hypothetical protein
MPGLFNRFGRARLRALRVLGLAAVALAQLVFTPAVRGQTVVGEVVSAADGRPVVGAFVILFDSTGRRQAGVLSDSDGRYRLRAAAAGRFTIRVEQIGFETVSSPLLELREGPALTHRFSVPVRAVALPGISVESESRCRRRDDGAAVHALWEEIRKALDLTSFTQREGGIRYTLMQHVRDLGADHRHVLDEQRTRRILSGSLPFTAAADAAELVRTGFRQDHGDEFLLLGPDADVLLSGDFAEGYCFRLVRAPSDGEIGLGFEPVRRRPNTTEITGVLWVDRRTAELRRLEFGYVGLPPDLARHDAGGTVNFRRLANGTWIVHHWLIRSPLLQRDVVTGATRRVGTREDGGTVLAAHGNGAALYELAGAGVIEGRVDDLLLDQPGAGLLVGLSGTPFTAMTDHSGRFRIEGVPPGSYHIAAVSDWMGELRTPAPLEPIVVPAGVISVHLATPSFASAMAQRCPDTPAGRLRQRYGVIYGVAHDPRTGRPLPGVTVRVEYARTAHDEVTDADGGFAFCWVPQNDVTPASVRIVTRQHRTAAVPLLLTRPILRYDF